MTWTYSGNPQSSTKDTVRYLIGDTVEASPMLQDEEIYFALSEVGNNIYRAASNSCYNLAALFTGMAQSESKSVGGLDISKSYGDRAQRYERLAKDLLARGRRVNPPSVSADPNALGAEFVVGEFDPYYAVANSWPSGSVLGTTTTYGTGYAPDYSGGYTSEEGDVIEAEIDNIEVQITNESAD
jgi:hypothetical protein